MAFGKPDLGSLIPGGSAFDPQLVNKLMGKFGHGGFLDMEYVGHGEDWVELAIDWREDLVADPDTGILAAAVNRSPLRQRRTEPRRNPALVPATEPRTPADP